MHSARLHELQYFVRFEAANGRGLFSTCSDFLELVESRTIRVPRQAVRDVETLYRWLCRNTSGTPAGAYRDSRCRQPVTWYKASATEHLRRADLLCALLNRERVDIRRIARRRIGPVLWEDEIQVVTRRERSPVNPRRYFVDERRARCSRRQARRRRRAGRVVARALKSAWS